MEKAAVPRLDRRGLRNFGLQLGGLIAAVFGLLLPWLAGRGIPLWPFVAGGVLAAFALLLPQALRPVQVFWMWLGLRMQQVVSPIVLAIIFYVVFLPTGALMRAFGKDPMDRGWDAAAQSYRIAMPAVPPEHMKRPF